MTNKSFWVDRTRTAELVKTHISEILQPLGMHPDAFNYAVNDRAYQRTPTLCTFWCTDPTLRDSLNIGIALHCLGIKLVDDLLDQDTEFSAPDLSLGIYLIQTGTSLLCTTGNHAAIHAVLKERYGKIWEFQLRELRSRPSNFSDWLATARVKSGEIMQCYTEVACFASGIVPNADTHLKWASALGTLIMIRDDLKDFYEKDEKEGNLAYLITQGFAQEKTARKLVDELLQDARNAIFEVDPEYDLYSQVIALVEDAHRRLDLICSGTGVSRVSKPE